MFRRRILSRTNTDNILHHGFYNFNYILNNCRFEGLYLIGYNISRWLNILAKGVIKKMKKILFTTNPQKIKVFSLRKILADKELKVSASDLEQAKITFKNDNYKWLITMAGCSIRFSPQCKAYYLKKRAEGKSHNHTLRCLARQLIKVIYKMLTEDREYIVRKELKKVA